VPARRAEQRRHRDTAMRDERFVGEASRTRICHGRGSARVGTPAATRRIGQEIDTLALVGIERLRYGLFAEDATIWRHVSNLAQQHAPVFELELQNFTILRNRGRFELHNGVGFVLHPDMYFIVGAAQVALSGSQVTRS
jgi:hypothetical protein